MKRVASIALALLAFWALLAPAANAAPGQLDTSFGAGGSERILPSQEDIFMNGVAIQPDGEIVLAGEDQLTSTILVARLLPGGGLDPSFGSGLVATPVGSPGGANAVAIQPDGKIVVAGEAKVGPLEDLIVVRYDSSGAPDPSFGGGDGIETIAIGANDTRAEAVAIGAGGRILVTGETSLGAGVEAVVAVLQPSGAPDPAFAGTGVETLETPGAEESDEGVAIAEQPDGKLVIADESGSGHGNGFTVVRLLPGGGFDPDFGTGGIAYTPIPNTGEGRSTDLALMPDGRIVAAGDGYDEGMPEPDQKFAVARYLSNGKLDPSFGGAGTGIFSEQAGLDDEAAETVAVTPTGKMLLAGTYSAATNDDSLAVMRLDSAGVLDPAFGAGGLALRGHTDPFGNEFTASALDSGERLVVVSEAYEAGGRTSVEVSRLLGDPPKAPPAPPQGSQALTQAPPKPVPHARMKAVARKLAAQKLTGFSGTASDSNGSVAKVQIALVKLAPGGARASVAGRTCQVLQNPKARFKVVKAKKGKPCSPRWLNATGTAKWRFKLKATLPPGRYVVYSRAVDGSGGAETSFSRAAGNRYAFRLLAP